MKKISLLFSLFILLNYLFFPSSLFALPTPEGIQVYQKNMHLSEEHKQRLAADIYRYYKADNIWDVLRHEFMLPHYEYMPQVQAQINWFLMHQDFLTTSANRAAPYLYYILQQVRKRHLPPELVLLPIMESSYNPFAYSHRGAAGIWQLMPGTAMGFGVKQNWWYDGRRDLITSTRTALDYLAYLGNFFGGNWLLAIAAYDTGEGNVLSAIKRNIREGLSTDIWTLPLAQETRDYIPRLLALAVIISNPDRYPILLPTVHNAPYLAEVDIGGQINLKQAAELAGLSLKKLLQLNPGFNQPTTDPTGPFKIILPIEHVQRFTENLEHTPYQQTLHWHYYKTKLGDTWASVAKRFSISTQALRSSNINLTSTLKPGKKLIIPETNQIMGEVYTQSFIANNKMMNTPKEKTYQPREFVNQDTFVVKTSTINPQETNTIANALTHMQGSYALQPGDTLYMIREGDSWDKIAHRFHMDSETVLAVNKNNSQLIPGEKIIIPTHLPPTSTVQTFPLTTGETIYMVKQGDNLESIAEKFHTTSNAIKTANLLSSNVVQSGDRLVIPMMG